MLSIKQLTDIECTYIFIAALHAMENLMLAHVVHQLGFPVVDSKLTLLGNLKMKSTLKYVQTIIGMHIIL